MSRTMQFRLIRLDQETFQLSISDENARASIIRVSDDDLRAIADLTTYRTRLPIVTTQELADGSYHTKEASL